MCAGKLLNPYFSQIIIKQLIIINTLLHERGCTSICSYNRNLRQPYKDKWHHEATTLVTLKGQHRLTKIHF